MDVTEIWALAMVDITAQVPSAQQRGYLNLVTLRAIVEDTALVSVPDAFARDIVEARLRGPMTDALSRCLARHIQIAVTVWPSHDPEHDDDSLSAGTTLADQEETLHSSACARASQHSTVQEFANPHATLCMPKMPSVLVRRF